MRRVKRKRKRYFGIAAVLALGMALMCLTACGSSGASADAEPYPVMIGDVEIRPGETTVQALADAGYELSDLSGREMTYDEDGNLTMLYTLVYDLTAEADGMTVYSAITVVKDCRSVALISICNETEDAAPLTECVVTTVTVYSDSWEIDKISIGGIALEGISGDALTEVLGEPGSVSESKDKYTWKNGLYTLELTYQEDGTLDNIRSNFNEFAS